MTALWIACGILATLLAVAAIKLLRLKADIRYLGKRLNEITQADTNAQLTTQTFDKDIAALAKNANTLLAKSRRDYVNAQRLEADLKRAIINISHDLRTPLTSAKGYLQMLEGQAASTEHSPSQAAHEQSTNAAVTTRYLSIIKGRLETLATLMDNLFAFSRAMDESISVKKVNIGNTLRDTLLGSYAELEAKGFTVESHIPDTPAYAICDEDALKRVLQNLIKNAYVHGKEYLRISLTGNTIEIANKSEGLNNIDITRIFDRFYTADAARTHKRTGLGLAISKELIRRMGGSITARHSANMLIIQASLPEA